MTAHTVWFIAGATVGAVLTTVALARRDKSDQRNDRNVEPAEPIGFA